MADTGKFVGDLTEDHLIHYFFAPIAEDLQDDVAAVNVPADHELLVSTDCLQEDIHFLRASPATLIAQKALRVNVSDILASGGRPRWFTLSLSMPRNLEVRWLSQFASGLKAAMNDSGVALIGGDTTAAIDKISIGITVLGHVTSGRRVGRGGARPGDWLGVTGNLGNAAAGLDVILGKHQLDPLEKWFWHERHFCPPNRARFAQGVAAQGLVTSMMDLSDGLLTDLPRLCRTSSVGALIDLSLLPLADEFKELGYGAADAARGGEDYELLFSANSAHWQELQELAQWAGTSISHVGTIISGSEVVWQQDGQRLDLDLPQWKHFA